MNKPTTLTDERRQQIAQMGGWLRNSYDPAQEGDTFAIEEYGTKEWWEERKAAGRLPDEEEWDPSRWHYAIEFTSWESQYTLATIPYCDENGAPDRTMAEAIAGAGRAIYDLEREVDFLRALLPAEGTAPLSVQEVGVRCATWRVRNFGEQSALRHALQICEEAGEVARAVGRANEGIRPETRGNLADELGDVIMSAAAMAHAAGFDIHEILRRRIARMEALDFRKDPNGGEG